MSARPRREGVPRKSANELLRPAARDSGEPWEARQTSQLAEKVRVWWPPTKDKNRTGFSGAYWPAAVLQRLPQGGLQVEYDNGDRERVDLENVFPLVSPIEFGGEALPLQVGEFVEVSNDSKTDPCAWLGKVAAVGEKKLLVDYPFHDSPSEYIKPNLLRRARIWEDPPGEWKFAEIGQSWRPGEVASPLELTLVTEQEFFRQLQQMSGGKSGGKSGGRSGKRTAAAAFAQPASDSEQDTSAAGGSSGDEQQPRQQRRGRPPKPSPVKRGGHARKSSHPTRAAIDEASSGSADRRGEKLVGARKRKPSSVRQA